MFESTRHCIIVAALDGLFYDSLLASIVQSVTNLEQVCSKRELEFLIVMPVLTQISMSKFQETNIFRKDQQWQPSYFSQFCNVYI